MDTYGKLDDVLLQLQNASRAKANLKKLQQSKARLMYDDKIEQYADLPMIEDSNGATERTADVPDRDIKLALIVAGVFLFCF